MIDITTSCVGERKDGMGIINLLRICLDESTGDKAAEHCRMGYLRSSVYYEFDKVAVADIEIDDESSKSFLKVPVLEFFELQSPVRSEGLVIIEALKI